MPNDQYGRPISVGDTVTIKGEVIKVLDDPNFLNCTVKLAALLPPSGTETTVQLNTAQLEKTSTSTHTPPAHPGGGQPQGPGHDKPTGPPSPPPPHKETPPPPNKERKEK